MTCVLVVDRPADGSERMHSGELIRYEPVVFDAVAALRPRFGTPGKQVCSFCCGKGNYPNGDLCAMCGMSGRVPPDAIPLRSAIVVAERCGKCGGSGGGQKPARYEHEDPYHETCDACSGTGFSGRGGAREVETECPRCKGEGTIEDDQPEFEWGDHIHCPDCDGHAVKTHWSLAVTGDVTPRDGLSWADKPAVEAALRMSALTALGSIGVEARDASWRGLLLHDNALYVVGVVAVGELAEGWRLGDIQDDDFAVGADGIRIHQFDGISRALWPNLGEILRG